MLARLLKGFCGISVRSNEELRLISMNRNFARLIPAMALALVLSVPAFAQSAAPAAAAPAPTASAATKVGIINIQAAIVNSNEGQRDFESLQKKFDPKRAELENSEQRS